MTETDNPGRIFSFGDELASPLTRLKSLADQMRVYEQDEARRSLTRDYRNLGKEVVGARLRGAAVGAGLKGKSQRMDHRLVQEYPEFVLACLEAYAQGLGINLEDPNENLPRDRLNYLLKLSPNDPYMRFIDSFNCGRMISQAFSLYIKTRFDLEDRDKLADLGAYLVKPENSRRFERSIKVPPVNLGLVDGLPFPPIRREGIIKVVQQRILPTRNVISLPAFLPVYAEWMVQAYQSTIHP